MMPSHSMAPNFYSRSSFSIPWFQEKKGGGEMKMRRKQRKEKEKEKEDERKEDGKDQGRK